MNAYHAFRSIRSQHIPALNVTLEEYEHNVTGAMHYHLASDNAENVFLVALRTVPEDSTGVAHILEHTALCGSEKYPVRDPFFMMIRRSLNTFMNAFTSSDWTAYPFASQNRKDFDNLLQVYMDAVFFSRLDELDFAQEGHRLEFEEADNPNSKLVFKGVVFNEMKGAMSSITSQLWQTLSAHLFPTNTYHYNSGGDPENIPDLSYAELKAFYETHYHPSNAMFMTYGDISAAEHQARFEALGLSRFEKLDEEIAVSAEKRYTKPFRVTEHYPLDDNDTSNKNHVVMGWLLGESTQLEDLLEAQLLANVLLDNSSSPLLQALETTNLGSAPSPLCGLEDSNRELVFCCGIEGAADDASEALEALVLGTLQDIASNGVEQSRMESVLHQLEFHQREVGGDGYPYGLQLIMAALGPATHRGDIASVLDIEPVLATLRERIQDKGYIKQLAQKLLLDNPHRVTLTLSPDTELSELRDKSEQARLDDIKSKLSADDAARIIEMTEQLKQRQMQDDDAGILPKVALDDVPASIPVHEAQAHTLGDTLPVTFMPQGTNGIVYQQLILPLPELSNRELRLLPLLGTFMTELGIGERDYLQTQALQAACCGSLSAFHSIRALPSNEQDARGHFVLSGKALNAKAGDLSELMAQTFEELRFDEQERMAELIAQITSRREQSITGNGHGLAMSAASNGMSPVSRLSYESSGMAGTEWIKALNKQGVNDSLIGELQSLLAKLQQQSRSILIVGEAERRSALLNHAGASFQQAPGGSDFSLAPVREQSRLAWQCNSQVNFCAKAYPTVSTNHEDAAALMVLAGFMRNGYLHRTIREQGGAYGGGASFDASNAAFRFYSYRDPRLTETMDDFDAACRWVLDSKHEWQAVEEAILGVVSSIDKPGSPAGEAKQQFHNELVGRDIAQRSLFRERVLAVKVDDLQGVTERWLADPKKASIGLISNEKALQENEQWLSDNAMERHSL